MTINDIRTAKNYKQTVLIVDDQSTALIIHAAAIAHIDNVKVVKLNHPKKALDWMTINPVDLILLDHHMFDMDGLEFIRLAKLTNFGLNVPVIVITVNNESPTHQALLDAGATHVFMKPIKLLQLIKLSDNLLAIRKMNYSKTQKHGSTLKAL